MKLHMPDNLQMAKNHLMTKKTKKQCSKNNRLILWDNKRHAQNFTTLQWTIKKNEKRGNKIYCVHNKLKKKTK